MSTNKGLNRVFFLSSVFGTFPLTFDYDNVSINYKTLAVSILIRITLLVGIVNLGILEVSSNPGKNIDKICTITQYSVTFACTFYTIWNKNEFAVLNQYYLKVDSELKKMGISASYKIGWSGDISVLILALLSFMVLPLWMRYEELSVDYFCEIFLETFVVWQCFTVVQPYVQCVTLVGERFSNVREIFSTLVQSKYDFNTNDKLESTIRIYDMLCSTCDQLMNLFSLQLMFVFFLVLLNVILAAFRLLLKFKFYSNIFYFILHFLELAYATVVCVYITTACKKTSEEADEFNNALNEAMIDESPINLCDNGKLRLHVIMKREVTFNVLGFLSLDYTLVHSVIAAATTYLVILLQFTEDAPSPTPPVRSPNYPY